MGPGGCQRLMHSSNSCCGVVSGGAWRSKGQTDRHWRWMAVRIVAGVVMPGAMRIAWPCSVLGTSALGGQRLGLVHAGWAMPGAEQGAGDVSLFRRWPASASAALPIMHGKTCSMSVFLRMADAVLARRVYSRPWRSSVWPIPEVMWAI